MISGKTVLVTGAGGFIGSHMARTLHRAGNRVVAVDAKPFGEWEPLGYAEDAHNKMMRLDMRREDDALLATKGCDFVFHFAANMGGMGFISKYPAEIVHDNMISDLNVLDAAKACGVQRFFFASSACVYPENLQMGDGSAGIQLKEDDAYPAGPDTAYGWEKLMMEEALRAYRQSHGLEVRIARYHNIYGPARHHPEREKAPAALCRKVANWASGPLEIWGDGKQVRSFLNIADCISGSLALMEAESREGFDANMPINIGSEHNVTIDELAEIAITVSGRGITELAHDVSKPQGVRYRNADISRARTWLGWEPKIGLVQGMAELYRYVERGRISGD